MGMEFEWDTAKAAVNIEKHHIDLDTASCIWDGPTIEKVSPGDHGETRLICLGSVDDRIIAVIYTWRGNIRRIISARRARCNERKEYSEALQRQPPE